MSTRRVASFTSLLPQAWKESPRPPKVAVPKLSTGTFNPEEPSCRNSMTSRCSEWLPGCGAWTNESGHACALFECLESTPEPNQRPRTGVSAQHGTRVVRPTCVCFHVGRLQKTYRRNCCGMYF